MALFFLSRKMAASRFRSFSEENIAQLLNDKDRENIYQKVDETTSLNFLFLPRGEKHQKSYNCSGVRGRFTKVLR